MSAEFTSTSPWPATTAGLLPQIYEELQRLAYRAMAREPRGLTLQPTALVHEVYLRLCAGGERRWADRAHFFQEAARAMRQALVDAARRRETLRRGGALARVPLEGLAESALGVEADPDLLDLDVALEELARVDPELARVVELRHFAGLPLEETALMLGVSPRTVRREWEAARLFLFEKIQNLRAGR
ncbi:MAG: ECF-type sigma factor [Planctomycetota bacterium]